MHDLPLEFKRLIKTENPWGYLLEAVWVRRRSWAIPVLMISAIILGGVFGLLATKLSLNMGVLALGGLIVFLVAFHKPEFVILLILAMSSTLWNVLRIPHFFAFSLVDFCLMFLLGLLVVRVLANKSNLVRTPLDWPVLLFFIAATISNLNAIYYLETVDVFRNVIWRVFLNYMVFFAVTNLIRTRRQLMILVGGMFVMATIVAAFMVAQQAVGSAVSILPDVETVHDTTVLGQRQVGVTRVSIEGALIVFVMLLPAFILYTTSEYLKKRKWLLFAPVVLFPSAIAFTFDRNMWGGALLGSIIFVLISRIKSNRFIWLILTLAISVVLLVPLFNAYFPRIGTIAEALTARFNSLFAGDELVYDGSTQWRLMENEMVIPKIMEHPILGLGPYAEYRPPQYSKDKLTRFVHNAYFWLLMNIGIVGFLPFLWFSIAHLIIGISSWYTLKDRILRALVIGFTLSYIALMVSNVAAPRFLLVQGAILVGVMLGINQVAIRLEQQSVSSTISNR